jgi:DNA recombination-dependent growth factor C
MSFTAFLLDPLKEGEAVKDRLVEQLNIHAHGRNHKLCDNKLQLGWVDVLNPLDAEFDFGKVFRTNFLAFSFREDLRRIPAGTFKLYLQAEVEKQKAAMNRQRLTKTERDELKAALEDKLLAQALPDIKVYDVLWFHQKGELLFFGTSRPVVERFRKLFRHAFERELLGRNGFTCLQRLELPKDVESLVLSLKPTQALVGSDDTASTREWDDGPGNEN